MPPTCRSDDGSFYAMTMETQACDPFAASPVFHPHTTLSHLYNNCAAHHGLQVRFQSNKEDKAQVTVCIFVRRFFDTREMLEGGEAHCAGALP